MHKFILSAMLLGGVVGVASAGQLITDGGFESGALDPNWNHSGSVGVATSGPHSGHYDAFLNVGNASGAYGDISQVITATKMTNIATFDAWYYTAGSTLILDIQDGHGGLHEFDKTFAGTGERWVHWDILSDIQNDKTLDQIGSIDFVQQGQGQNGDNHYFKLDDVSMTTQSVPEPISLSLLVPGAIALIRRRKR